MNTALEAGTLEEVKQEIATAAMRVAAAEAGVRNALQDLEAAKLDNDIVHVNVISTLQRLVVVKACETYERLTSAGFPYTDKLPDECMAWKIHTGPFGGSLIRKPLYLTENLDLLEFTRTSTSERLWYYRKLRDRFRDFLSSDPQELMEAIYLMDKYAR